MRILIVEDEKNLAMSISDTLKRNNYTVDMVHDGEDGLYNGLTDIYDLIILDVMLPKMNGFEILSELRKNKIKARILILTAKYEIDDKLRGFDNGADDYITKPFHIKELVARVNYQLKKDNINDNNNEIKFKDLILNLSSYKLTCDTTKESINLVKKEFELLEYLMLNISRIISKEQILDKIWGLDSDVDYNNVEAYISFVRKKIKAIGSLVNLKAIRGIGYRLE